MVYKLLAGLSDVLKTAKSCPSVGLILFPLIVSLQALGKRACSDKKTFSGGLEVCAPDRGDTCMICPDHVKLLTSLSTSAGALVASGQAALRVTFGFILVQVCLSSGSCGHRRPVDAPGTSLAHLEI